MPIQTSPRFLACLPFTLAQEGGYSNDAHDPGGMTMRGIVQREYDAYRRAHNLPTRWIKNISDDEIKDIYFRQYWLPTCPLLPAGLDLSFFDNAVNEGPHAGLVLLQRAIEVHADGAWGPETVRAIAKTPEGIREQITRYADAREAYYHGLRNFQFFAKGWLRRAREIETHSLEMVTA